MTTTTTPKARSSKGAAARADLMRALISAQGEAPQIVKDGIAHDAGQSFTFAGAEAFIMAAKALLKRHELALIPVGQRVIDQNGDGSSLVLSKEWVIVHVGGGEMLLKAHEWPIVVDASRPLDKATAAADTASLSYFLRDLLQFPRVDEDARLDTHAAPRRSGGAVGSGGVRGKTRMETLKLRIKEAFDAAGVDGAEDERNRRARAILGKTPTTIADLEKLARRMGV